VPTLSEAIFHAAAVQLAAMPDTWRALLAEHRRGPSGHCAAPSCGRPGYGTPDWQPHPCGARAVAERARALHREAEQAEHAEPTAQSDGGSPSCANSPGPNVVISAITPSSTRSTSSLNGRNTVSPGRRR
jgi:hypothetical protein